MASLAGAVCSFLETEAMNILQAEKPLEVSKHTTFNRVKAAVLTSCTCKRGPGGAGDPKSCHIHCPEPSLAEIIFAVGQEVFASFGDEFTCFATLFMEAAAKGWVRECSLSLSLSLSLSPFCVCSNLFSC